MRRARITYEGAFHHVMNRGIKGEAIFSGDLEKSQFLDYLKEFSQKLRIRLLAYCVMDNHYHIIIQNSSGRMSEAVSKPQHLETDKYPVAGNPHHRMITDCRRGIPPER